MSEVFGDFRIRELYQYLNKMTKGLRRKGIKSIFCCRNARDNSDDENSPQIQPVALIDRVIEDEETESPFVSTGNAALASPNSLKTCSQDTSETEYTGLHRGDAVQAANAQSPAKVVHFAICHEQPPVKDTRDNYRHTPLKVKTKSTLLREEYFFLKSKDDEEYVKVPMSSFKTFVSEYVKEIVDSAVESIADEDNRSIGLSDVTLEVLSLGSECESTEEEVISEMVDNILAQVTGLTDDEYGELPSPRESRSTDSNATSVGTVESLAASLEWDGYEPLLLREDPSSTDISIRYQEQDVSSGMDV